MGTRGDTLKMFETVLEQFQRLPVKRVKRTFMQISGYPHYENVCSNILAFFMDPSNEHGLGDVVLQALFRALDIDAPVDFVEVEIAREYPTVDGGRLDLLITHPGFLLGIENKIFHQLDNDLKAYGQTMRTLAESKGLEHIGIVLGLRPMAQETSVSSSGFTSLTYEELFEELKPLLGHYGVRAPTKYLSYLYDFIQTIEDLEGTSMSNQEKATFYETHYAEVELLVSDYKAYKAELGPRHIPILHGLIEDLERGPHIDRIWVYAKHDLVSDFTFKGAIYALETLVTPGGWKLLLWPRTKRGTQHTLEALLSAIEADGFMVERPTQGRPVIGHYTLDTPHDEIARVLRRHHQIIHEQFDALS